MQQIRFIDLANNELKDYGTFFPGFWVGEKKMVFFVFFGAQAYWLCEVFALRRMLFLLCCKKHKFYDFDKVVRGQLVGFKIQI